MPTESRHLPLHIDITRTLNTHLEGKGRQLKKKSDDCLHSNDQVNGRMRKKESTREREGIWLGF